MTEQEKIIAKIREAAYESVNKKLEDERKKVENKVNSELKDVERCLQFIKNKMVFKIIDRTYLNKEYILADENTFFEDYTSDVEYEWHRGIKFSDPSDEPYTPLFKVNGREYYDIRYIIRHYEATFNDYEKRLIRLREQFETVTELANNLIKQEPCIKKLIEQYKQVEIDESFLEASEDFW